MMVQWDIPLLEKFKDKVDWKKVSESFVVLWSLPLLERFEQYICWDTLSDNYNPALISLLTTGIGQNLPTTLR